MKVLLDSNVPFALAHGAPKSRLSRQKGAEEIGVGAEGIVTQELIRESRAYQKKLKRINFSAVKLDTAATSKPSLQEPKEIPAKGINNKSCG